MKQIKKAIILSAVKKDGVVTFIEIKLRPKKKENFTLVDVDNHQTYDVDELEYADLKMDGKHTRTFRWVRGEVTKRDFNAIKLR